MIRNTGLSSIWADYGGMLITLLASLAYSVSVLLVKMLRDYGILAPASALWVYAGTIAPAVLILSQSEHSRRVSSKLTIKAKAKPNAVPLKNERESFEELPHQDGLGVSFLDNVWPLTQPANRKTLARLLVSSFL
jgi:hypothetical protein